MKKFCDFVKNALDGKTVKGSQDRINGRNAIHCLNVFVTEHHTVIRQIIGENKESEITMLPKIIESIDMKGATVTIDRRYGLPD